ncbi:MAG: BREX-1 system phosphatase PglZ type A [Lachnospirales bacterium]
MSLDIIKKNLIERFNNPLEDFYKRRIIFWQDEEKEFNNIDELFIENVKIIKLTDTNNFEIKKLLTLDDLNNNYLIYNNIKYENEESNWLLDIQLYSEVFYADYFSLKMNELNIKNTPSLRKAVKGFRSFFENKDRISALKAMGKTYSNPLPLVIDITSVLCGLKIGSLHEIIKAILKNGTDSETNSALINITKFGNINAFWSIVREETGYIHKADKTLNNFANHLFLTALSQNISTTDLKCLEEYICETKQVYCYSLINGWINGNNPEDLLIIAREVEERCNLVNLFHKFEIITLNDIDVFPCINEIIIKKFLEEIKNDIVKVQLIFDTNTKRRTSSWIYLTENYYDCIYNVAKMQEFYLKNIGGYHIVEPEKVLKFYRTSGYKMDTYYRKFYLAYSNALNSDSDQLKSILQESTVFVNKLYKNIYLSDINKCWLTSIEHDLNNLGYISEIPKQRSFYSKYLRSNDVKNSKIFVIISDALRYEVAVQLKDQLNIKTNGKINIDAMQSIFPSITSYGMAALLPNKEISVDNTDFSVLVDGNSTKSKDKRELVLKNANKNSMVLRYLDLYNMKSQERRNLTTGMEVIYIYHDTISAIGDKATTEHKVFDACEDAIVELVNTVKFIVNDMNGTNIFITSDHGFLFTHESLAEIDKISKSSINGDVYESGRRYLLASKNSHTDYLTKIDLHNEIKGLDIGYTPKDIVWIKKSVGGENFVYGGVSLQEMIIPVITFKNLRSNSKQFKEVEFVELEVVTMTRLISNTIFNINFLQKQPVGEKMQSCNYSIYFTDELGNIVSDIQTIIADIKSIRNEERQHKVRFNLKAMAFKKEKTYKLVINNMDSKETPHEIEYNIDIPLDTDKDYEITF